MNPDNFQPTYRTYNTYKLTSYINASHAVRWEGGMGKEHMHTWAVICEIHVNNDRMVPFNAIEAELKEVSSRVSGKFLNEVPPFDRINPTLENLTTYFFQVISDILRKSNAVLTRLEIGESPTRFYCMTLDQWSGQ